jgi:hypothetical protein
MRYRRGEVDADCRSHHLPEAEQRRSGACLPAEQRRDPGVVAGDSGAMAQRGMTDAAPALPESAVKTRFIDAICLLTQRDRHVSNPLGRDSRRRLEDRRGNTP